MTGRSIRWLAAILGVVIFGGWSASANAEEPPKTVTISGFAWAFVLSGTTNGLEGAVVRIAEYPDLQAVTDEGGAWSLEVPNHAAITPYASAPDRYTIHNQTYFTRDKDLNQVNFQMPPQGIVEAFAAIVGATMSGEAGEKVLDECGIVSTVYEKEGRSFFELEDFLRFAPHGVTGARAEAFDRNGDSIGEPVYFNKDVIPDYSQPHASRDGGMVWPNLSEGTYTVTASHETARFSTFQATCKPGRLVNASPPWGLYEMHRTEEPNPAVLPAPVIPEPEPEPEPVDRSVEAGLAAANVVRKGPRLRILQVRIRARETVRAAIVARQGKRQIRRVRRLNPGTHTIRIAVRPGFRPGALNLRVSLRDAAGNATSSASRLFVPRIKPRPVRQPRRGNARVRR